MTEKQVYKILVYGIERKGLSAPSSELRDRNYILTFNDFRTESRFSEFDGVILFNGIFEEYKWRGDWEGDYLNHSCERDELDKRKNELRMLLKNGGFVCFILCEPFRDKIKGGNFESTDLAKAFLLHRDFYRRDLDKRITNIRIVRDEFRQFLEPFGGASSYFINLNKNIKWRVVAYINREVVGMVLFDQVYSIPALLPQDTPERVQEYFHLLADAITSTAKKLEVEVPPWAQAFKFTEETELEERRELTNQELQSINGSLNRLERFKRILVWANEPLVDAVRYVLEEGFSFDINPVDEFKEDLKIVSEDGESLVLVEVKGVNRGVKREHINQADSHRERAGLPSHFPVALIINTHMKNARTIEEKDQQIASEQIRHASAANVLILRTLDLLKMVELINSGRITQGEVLQHLTGGGWLRVIDDSIERVTE